MKAYRVELLIIDHHELGENEIKSVLQHAHYPNDCISPDVVDIESAEIGEWDDKHLLNCQETWEAEYQRLFGIANEQEL